MAIERTPQDVAQFRSDMEKLYGRIQGGAPRSVVIQSLPLVAAVELARALRTRGQWASIWLEDDETDASRRRVVGISTEDGAARERDLQDVIWFRANRAHLNESGRLRLRALELREGLHDPDVRSALDGALPKIWIVTGAQPTSTTVGDICYAVTPASLALCIAGGFDLGDVVAWFQGQGAAEQLARALIHAAVRVTEGGRI